MHYQPSIHKPTHRRTSSRRRCLSQLQAATPVEVFQSTSPPYPSFFHNLQFEHDYKAKVFRDKPQAYLQIFACCYLNLCFDSKNAQRSSNYLDYLYELLQKPQFQLILPYGNSELCEHNSMGLKNIISQYLNYMSSSEDTVLHSFTKYPLMLEIFVSFFRTLLFLGDICNDFDQELEMEATYEFLTSYFDVQATMCENYVFFSQANIYVYQENYYEIYMFYTLQESEYSSFFNHQGKQEQVYRSGYSSVKYLMSNMDKSQSSNSQISSKVQIMNKKVKILPDRRSKRIISIEQRQMAANKAKANSNKKIKEQANDQSKISYNYTQSSKTLTFQVEPLADSNSISHQPQQKSFNVSLSYKPHQDKMIAFEDENQQVKKQNQCLKSQKRLSKHSRNKSQFNQYITMNKQTLFSSNEEPSLVSYGELTRKVLQTSNRSILDHSSQKKEQLVDTAETFYRPPMPKMLKFEPKHAYIWANKNITKQFTSSFIVQTLPQPYKSSIKVKKERARQIRKSAYNALF